MTATSVTEDHAPTGCAHDTVGHDSAGQDEFGTDVVSHSDENSEERPETTHRVHALTYAARAIRRYRTTVVGCGTPGIVVDVHPAPRTTYTVEFQPKGRAGATIRVPALTDADLAQDPP